MIITIRVFGLQPSGQIENMLGLLKEAIVETLGREFEIELHVDPMFDQQKALHIKYGGPVTERGLIIVREGTKPK